MDLNVLDQSSKMTPLLVKLYDSHRLHSLARDEQPEARAELVTAVSELLDMSLSPRENELLSDVLISLMRQAEKDLRKALSERLSVVDNAPLRLVIQLANDEIEVADPILSKSLVLNDLDLIYIIKSKGADHWQSIAKRPKISDQIINILVDTEENGTMITLAKNRNVKLTEYALDVMTSGACKDDALAKPLLQREEVSAEIAQRLYQHVGEALKAQIIDTYDLDLDESVVNAIDDVMFEFSEVCDDPQKIMPGPSLIKVAQRYKEKNLLTMKFMLESLRRGQIPSFVAQFSEFTGMSPETVVDILTQSSGQGLAVTCCAYEIEKTDFVSIFLLTNRVRNGEQMVDLKGINKAMEYYNRITPDVAMGIVKNSLTDTRH